MTELAWEYTADGAVRTSGPLGDWPAISPSGERIAYLPVRTRAVDLVERERVRVAAIETGEVLAALDGPATLRALHWIREDRLLVARDAKGGRWVGLYEVPPGELVAEGFLPGASERRFTVTQTPDARVVCLQRDAATSFRGAGTAWLLDGTTLAVLRRVAEPPESVCLHPDGPRVLGLVYVPSTTGPSDVRLAVDPPCGPRWDLADENRTVGEVRWSGRDLATVLLKSSPLFDEDDSEDLSRQMRVRWHEVDVTRGAAVAGGDLGDERFDAAALSPDGARLATLRRYVRDGERGSEALLELRELGETKPYARGGSALRDVQEQPTAAHVVWSANGEHAVALLRTYTEGLMVGVFAGRGSGALEYPAQLQWPWSRGLSLHGGWIAEWLSPKQRRVRLIDRAALR